MEYIFKYDTTPIIFLDQNLLNVITYEFSNTKATKYPANVYRAYVFGTNILFVIFQTIIKKIVFDGKYDSVQGTTRLDSKTLSCREQAEFN